MVVDHHMEVLPARDAGQAPLEPRLFLACAAASDTVARTPDTAELLDVDVHELAGMAALVSG